MQVVARNPRDSGDDELAAPGLDEQHQVLLRLPADQAEEAGEFGFDEPAIEIASTAANSRPSPAGETIFNRRLALRSMMLGALILSHNLTAFF